MIYIYLIHAVSTKILKKIFHHNSRWLFCHNQKTVNSLSLATNCNKFMPQTINHISKQQLIFSQRTAWSMDRSHQCIVLLRWRNLYSATATVIPLFSPLLPKQYLPSQIILFLACPPAVSSAVVWPTATLYPPQHKVVLFYSIFSSITLLCHFHPVVTIMTAWEYLDGSTYVTTK